MNKLKKNSLQKIQTKVLKIAQESGKTQLRYFRKKLNVKEKYRAGIVTEVDLKVENYIRKELAKLCPDFGYIGEETDPMAKIDPQVPTWHVDPLDGTTNFAHGFPIFCVSIGLSWKGTPLLGVVHAPALQETWYAFEGGGAFLNKKRIKVSKEKKLAKSLLSTGFSYSWGPQLNTQIKHFKKLSHEARAIRRPGAAALDLAYVASGNFDGFWERNLKSWDICAGAALILAAGGKISSHSGKKLDLLSGEILATNGLIHNTIKRRLNSKSSL